MPIPGDKFTSRAGLRKQVAGLGPLDISSEEPFREARISSAAAGIVKPRARLLKVWLYVALMFCLISALSYAMTGDVRTIAVVGVVCVALGLLGSLMAAASYRHTSGRQPV